jgi:hypothetical protein
LTDHELENTQKQRVFSEKRSGKEGDEIETQELKVTKFAVEERRSG